MSIPAAVEGLSGAGLGSGILIVASERAPVSVYVCVYSVVYSLGGLERVKTRRCPQTPPPLVYSAPGGGKLSLERRAAEW